MTKTLLLSFVLVGTPLVPISYPACFTESIDDADLIAHEVQTIKEARWCVTVVQDCRNALIVILKKTEAKETYVVSESCASR